VWGLALPGVAALPRGDGAGESGHCGPVAPPRLSAVVALVVAVRAKASKSQIANLIRQMCLAKPCSFAPRFTCGSDEIFGSDTHRFQSLRNNEVRLASCVGVGGSSRCAKGIMRCRQFLWTRQSFLTSRNRVVDSSIGCGTDVRSRTNPSVKSVPIYGPLPLAQGCRWSRVSDDPVAAIYSASFEVGRALLYVAPGPDGNPRTFALSILRPRRPWAQ
jgi:hypothetical protein